MPKIFRAMKADDDGKPVVESSSKGLGVRSGGPDADVDLDDSGLVILNAKGMSVAPSWRELPFHRIPKRLKHMAPKARGSDDTSCFRMGKGRFESDYLATGLTLIRDSPTHGVVAPLNNTTLEQFQRHLAETKGQWTIEED